MSSWRVEDDPDEAPVLGVRFDEVRGLLHDPGRRNPRSRSSPGTASGVGSSARPEWRAFSTASGMRTATQPDFRYEHPWQQPRRTVTPANHASLAAYWFGWSFVMMPWLAVILPSQIKLIQPENHVDALSDTLLIGSLASLFLSPLFGSLSDHSQNHAGARRPYMLQGLSVMTLGFLVLAFAPSLQVLQTAYFIVSVGQSAVLAPYSALVPDVIPANQRGVSSSWLGAFNILGTIAGGAMTYPIDQIGHRTVYFILLLVHGGSLLVTVLFVPEVPRFSAAAARSQHGFSLLGCVISMARPFLDHDFRWLFFSRLMLQMGVTITLDFLQYFFEAALTNFRVFGVELASSPAQAVSVVLGPLLVGALVSSIFAGVLSDRLGGRRKVIVYAAGVLMGFAGLVFALARTFQTFCIVSFVFGCGFGAFTAIDWAMAADVLPEDGKETGKDMGLWMIAWVLPQVFAASLGNLLVSWLEPLGTGISFPWGGELHLGFTVIFLCSSAFIGGGCAMVKLIRGVQ